MTGRARSSHACSERTNLRGFLLTSSARPFSMTSHSKEAIEKVLALGGEFQGATNPYTLYGSESKTLVRRMTCEEALEASEYWESTFDEPKRDRLRGAQGPRVAAVLPAEGVHGATSRTTLGFARP